MKKVVIHWIGVFCMVVISSNNILAQAKRLPYKLSVIVDESTVYEEEIKATPVVLRMLNKKRKLSGCPSFATMDCKQ